MKTKLAFLLLLAASMAVHADSGWLTDFEKARADAAKKNIPILIDFSGSDWCGWCIKLHKEVLSKKAFKDYAADNVVLFRADFPQFKEQPKDVAAQNKALATTYGVQGFPTVLLLDKDGKKLAQTGYLAGGPEKYVQHLKVLINKSKK